MLPRIKMTIITMNQMTGSFINMYFGQRKLRYSKVMDPDAHLTLRGYGAHL